MIDFYFVAAAAAAAFRLLLYSTDLTPFSARTAFSAAFDESDALVSRRSGSLESIY